MATILVTGASGFIGGHLTEALASRGEHVRCLVRSSSDISLLQKLGVEFIVGELHDSDVLDAAIRGTNVVFHVAGLTAPLYKQDLWRVNEQGTAAVAQACARQASPPVHVYVSSIAAGGPAPWGRRRVESDAATPVSDYGRSKLAGELAAARYAGRVPTTIVRPGIVFGPRNRECLPIFQTIDRLGLHPVAGFRSPPLSYIPIQQLVELLLRAAERGARLADPASSTAASPGYYYATLNEFPSYADFGRLVGEALGRSRTLVLPLATPLVYTVAALHQFVNRWRGRADHFNVDKIREAKGPSWACSSALAQRELGFEPKGTLAMHLRDTVEWYRDYGWLPLRPTKSAAAWKQRSSTPQLDPGPSTNQKVFHTRNG